MNFRYVFATFLMTATAMADDPNYDEALVPDFELPDPLKMEDGTKVTSPENWPTRRAEILNLFAEHVYGTVPDTATREGVHHRVTKTIPDFLGKAELREVEIHFAPGTDGPSMTVLLLIPNGEGPFPTFLTLNFYGNHTIHSSPEITLNPNWMRANKDKGVVDNRATEESRGMSSNRWSVDRILDSGCALATVYYGDMDPDFDDGFENGLHALTGKPSETEWGSIATWSWGLGIARDYLETEAKVDQERVAVMGHSRLGKTALWAGATDERYALVISNNSGCGGAALNRRRFGEKVKRINTSFPHWFNDRFQSYNDLESELPVDQHQLVALIAPRRVYIASAVEDRWADPRGEFLSAKYAEPVYELLGKSGLGVDEQPAVDQPVGKEIRYHVRTGKHDVTDFDWIQYIEALKSL